MDTSLACVYNQLWADAHKDLGGLLVDEATRKSLPPVKLVQHIAKLYVCYVRLFGKLEMAYKWMVHPQKRRAIRPLLDNVMVRLVELRLEMADLDSAEHHCMDEVLVRLKITPADLEFPIPCYFQRENGRYAAVGTRELSACEAVGIIQVAQRTESRLLRVARLQQARALRECAALTRESKRERERSAPVDRSPAGLERAVIVMQKVWRGQRDRRWVKKDRQDEDMLLGLELYPSQLHPSPAEKAILAYEAQMLRAQQQNEEEFQQALVDIGAKLIAEEGADMTMTLIELMRQWFIECRDATGCFPDFPDVENGGSSVIFTEKTPEQLMAEMAKETRKQGEALKIKEKKDPEIKLSAVPPEFVKSIEIYRDLWESRDESRNFYQRYDLDYLKEQSRKEMEAKLRLQVDEQMRKELVDLKLAVDKIAVDNAAGKKKKGEKGKKEKKVKDPTANRSMESLCEELVMEGLLKQPDRVKMDDFLGAYVTGMKGSLSLFDVCQLMKLYAVLPLGCKVVHERAPLIPSILLVGPPGVGKKILVHAVCQETGANLFDLSPLNTAGKYPGKDGLAMMIHMVFKVAQQIQPSVIWVGDIEKMFYKKVPVEEKQMDPKRLKVPLLKAMKTLRVEDRVLVLATTSDPAKADKSLAKAMSRIILIPQPDYISARMLWRKMIESHGGQVTASLEVSSLATMTYGYTPGQIKATVRSVLTEQRCYQLAVRPLVTEEFIGPIAKMASVVEQDRGIEAWYADNQQWNG